MFFHIHGFFFISVFYTGAPQPRRQRCFLCCICAILCSKKTKNRKKCKKMQKNAKKIAKKFAYIKNLL